MIRVAIQFALFAFHHAFGVFRLSFAMAIAEGCCAVVHAVGRAFVVHRVTITIFPVGWLFFCRPHLFWVGCSKVCKKKRS